MRQIENLSCSHLYRFLVSISRKFKNFRLWLVWVVQILFCDHDWFIRFHDAAPLACDDHRHTDYLYVVTASNWGGANGFIGYFLNTTLGEETTTGDGIFEVFAAGKYPETNPSYPDHWNQDHGSDPLKLPTQAEVDNAISFAQANDYWESGIINPHLILADLIAIFHPDVLSDHQLFYYKQIF